MPDSLAGTAHKIEARQVSKYFGRVIALENVSIAVRSGEVHCVLGDNGAGKSTLIQAAVWLPVPGLGRHLSRRRTCRP